MTTHVPPSGEVLAEEILASLEELCPRERQGEVMRAFVREVADEMVAVIAAVRRLGREDGG